MEFQFDDGKDPEALRTIGEVARALDIRQHVLRYWEEQFPMLSPIKRSGGRRYYRPEDIQLIARIDHLVNREGYTLRGACSAIEASAKETVSPPQPAVAPSGVIVERLEAIRSELAQALDAA